MLTKEKGCLIHNCQKPLLEQQLGPTIRWLVPLIPGAGYIPDGACNQPHDVI
jgi:hypothetical protein